MHDHTDGDRHNTMIYEIVFGESKDRLWYTL
jgi:hypothetical protein